MDLLERLRAWTYSRQRLGDPASTPEDALRAVVAIYATHPTTPLALAARTRSLTAQRYRRIDRDGTGLRIPAMRRTLFLVPRAHAARIFTAVRRPESDVTRSLKRQGMSLDDYARVGERVLTRAREPVEARALGDVGVGGQSLGAVLRCLRYEGRLLALAGDSMMSSAHRYVAADAWAPEGLDAGDRKQALSWLAGEYLRAYGPARVADFAWWAGVPKRAADDAVRVHDTADVGDGLLLHARDEAGLGRVRRLRGTVDLLPKWDAYTMGHAPDGRARFVHPDVQRAVYTPIGTGLSGDGNPVVLVDGEAVGLWTFTLKDGARVEPFDTLGPSVRRKVDEKLEQLAKFLTR